MRLDSNPREISLRLLRDITNTVNDKADSLVGSFSNRNKIINGSFAINQRAYVSGAATTAGQYTLDRWKVTGTGGIAFSTTANKTTVTIPTGQALQQVIEGLNLQSGTYVLSWEGTAQGKIGAGSYGAYGVTNEITGGTDTTIEFGPGTVANVQLELGSVASQFEVRPYGTELALCQRYYQTAYVIDTRYQAAGEDAATALPFTVTPRASPTLVVTAAGSNINHGTISVATLQLFGALVYAAATASGSVRIEASLTVSAEL